MTKCVKCGYDISRSGDACGRCTWPLTRNAWVSTTHKIHRITLDTGCINAKGRDPDLNTLEQWAAAGHLELQRSDVMLTELKGKARIAKARSLDPHPGLFNLDSSVLGDSHVLAGPDLSQELQQILFPTANPLTTNQQSDVKHLQLHVRTGGDIFVTLNPNDFITYGRQEMLASVGIWVLSPNDIVSLLRQLYAWSY